MFFEFSMIPNSVLWALASTLYKPLFYIKWHSLQVSLASCLSKTSLIEYSLTLSLQTDIIYSQCYELAVNQFITYSVQKKKKERKEKKKKQKQKHTDGFSHNVHLKNKIYSSNPGLPTTT